MLKDLESGSKRGPQNGATALWLCPLQYLESGSRRGPEIAPSILRGPETGRAKKSRSIILGEKTKNEKTLFLIMKGEKEKPYNLG